MGLSAFGGTAAHAAAGGCSGTFQVTALTVDRPSVQPGQSFTATATLQNCTGQPQTLRADWRARSVMPAGMPNTICTANDPYPIPEVQVAAGATYSNSTPWTVWPNCPATAIQLTLFSWDAGALATITIPVGADNPPPSCTASYQTISEWSSGFVGQVTVTNPTGAPISRWSVTFAYPGDQQVTGWWNAVAQQRDRELSATNAAWDGNIPPGASVGFGLYGEWHRSDAVPTVLTCQAS
jgi:Cellulose binding domain